MTTMLPPIEIHRPSTVDQACSLLAELGDDARPYAGGVALLLAMKQGFVTSRHLIDIKKIPALLEVSEEPQGIVRIGAAVTHRQIARSPIVRRAHPALADAAATLGNERVRNVGTLGGNLCFAEPDSDPATVLLVLDASIRIEGQRGPRTLKLDEFLRGPFEVALETAELLTSVEIPKRPERTAVSYLRFGVLERPLVSVAASVTLAKDGRSLEDVHIAVGGAGPRPVRARDAEAMLRGQSLVDAIARLADAGDKAAEETRASDDHRASAEYRRAMIKVLVQRAVAAARAAVDDKRR